MCKTREIRTAVDFSGAIFNQLYEITDHAAPDFLNTNTMSNTADTLKFLLFMGKLKDTKRTGWVLRDVPEPESIADHMYRMAIMAMIIGNHTDAAVDKDKCIRMSLVHDMGECIAGDITPACGISKEEKFKREQNAMHTLGHLVDSATGEELRSLWMEYEGQDTPEARLVKDLDRFDMILQAYDYEVQMVKPGKLQEFFDSTYGKFENSVVKEWVEELYKMRSQLLLQDTPEGPAQKAS
ncbi:5'-deoxynucleotidase HDDC2-like [Ornithodoros turicata]|uniref:5'-deoxynucleotidase HDDC2-like n=1 Tax=Ornithodoros turicata TaxID=34597 RepID=UPI00313915DF